MLTKVNKKHVLFVSYGGGHIELIKAILPAIIKTRQYKISVIALTVAWKEMVDSDLNGITLYKLSDFRHLFIQDEALINALGLRFLKENYSPLSGVSEEETVFYLGLSMLDLVREKGEERALELYELQKRQCFNPVRSFERIISYLSPEIIFTTNSPRSEFATIQAAKNLGVPSVQILDLFGDGYPPPTADHIFVLNEKIKQKLQGNGVKSLIYPVGQPVFDLTGDSVKQVDVLSKRLKLSLAPDKKILLFCPTRYLSRNKDMSLMNKYIDPDIFNVPIFEVLDFLISTFDIQVIIRPHPVSDSIENYKKYFHKRPGYNYFSNDQLNVIESIAISDICLGYISTICVQAAVCKKTVFTYNYDINIQYPLPELTQQPFHYSANLDELKENIVNYLSNSDLNSQEAVFFQYGANERIKSILAKILWNS